LADVKALASLIAFATLTGFKLCSEPHPARLEAPRQTAAANPMRKCIRRRMEDNCNQWSLATSVVNYFSTRPVV
jgi:hypothetical protein